MKNKNRWNNLLGLASVLILIGTTFYALNDFSDGSESSTIQATTKKTKNTKETEETEETTSSVEKTEKPSDLPKTSDDDWSLVLVGPTHKIKNEIAEDQLVEAVEGTDEKIARRIYDNYHALSQAAEKAGYPLVIVSAFRSVAYQKQVFDSTVTRNMSQKNLNEKDAIELTKQTVTEPGFSEHHTGLAVDVVDEYWYNNYQNQASEVLDTAFGNQAGAKWLAKNADKYGFIVRYPQGKEAITGITYEPWHLRFVGVENAEYITKHNLTMEEYLELLNQK